MPSAAGGAGGASSSPSSGGGAKSAPSGGSGGRAQSSGGSGPSSASTSGVKGSKGTQSGAAPKGVKASGDKAAATRAQSQVKNDGFVKQTTKPTTDKATIDALKPAADGKPSATDKAAADRATTDKAAADKAAADKVTAEKAAAEKAAADKAAADKAAKDKALSFGDKADPSTEVKADAPVDGKAGDVAPVDGADKPTDKTVDGKDPATDKTVDGKDKATETTADGKDKVSEEAKAEKTEADKAKEKAEAEKTEAEKAKEKAEAERKTITEEINKAAKDLGVPTEKIEKAAKALQELGIKPDQVKQLLDGKIKDAKTLIGALDKFSSAADKLAKGDVRGIADGLEGLSKTFDGLPEKTQQQIIGQIQSKIDKAFPGFSKSLGALNEAKALPAALDTIASAINGDPKGFAKNFGTVIEKLAQNPTALAKVAPQLASDVLNMLPKDKALKLAAKMGLRKVPIAGTIVAGASDLYDLAKDPMNPARWMNVGSTIAGVFAGPGTAVSLGLDMGALAYDAKDAISGFASNLGLGSDGSLSYTQPGSAPSAAPYNPGFDDPWMMGA